MSRMLWPTCKACVVSIFLFGAVNGRVSGDEATATEAANRPIFRGQRPDESRGWFVIAKESYWPLCYESLDRINEAKQLIGTADHGKTADAFDKCAAWLKVAASAAMTDGNSGVQEAAFAFDAAANSLREGSSDWSEAELSDLTTLAFVVMAKSHVLRADSSDQNFKAQRASKTSKNPTVQLKAAAKEIAKENTDRTIAQYHYDAIEAQRHLSVAQEYLKAAAKAGQFKVDDNLMAPVPEFKAGTVSGSAEYVDTELRARIRPMSRLLAEQQQKLRKKLSDKL